MSIAKVIMSQSQSLANTRSIRNVLIRGKGLEDHTGIRALCLLSLLFEALVISLPCFITFDPSIPYITIFIFNLNLLAS